MEDSKGTLYLAAPDVEEIVLGAVLLEKECLYNIAGDFSEKLFYEKKNQIVARACLNLFITNRPIDLITVTNELKKMNELDNIGGAYFVSSLTNRIASTANVDQHVKILQQHYLSRYINEICSDSRFRLFNGGHDIFDVYSEMQQKLEEALKDIISHEVSSVRDIHVEAVKQSLENIKSGSLAGVITGLKMLDRLTNGWQPTDLVIVAGRSGMGKTAFAISMLLNAAVLSNTPVAMFSLEMSKQQVIGRMQSSLSGINVSRIIKKQVTREELEIIDNACKPLYHAPIYIDDTPNISLVELKMKARKLVRDQKVKAIYVDYLQLMKSGLKTGSREQEVAEISKGLKAIAKELDIPVIALSQLSRAVEQRADKKPQLSDLRESGQIEQDADMVVFCYRPEYYGITNYEVGSESFDSNGLFMAIISKHRNGELGEIPMRFVHEQTKVANHEYQSVSESNTNIKLLSLHNIESNTNVNLLEAPKEDLPF